MTFSSLAEPNETVFDNKITYYRDSDTVDKLVEVARQFELSLWTDTRTIVDLCKAEGWRA